MVHRVSSLQEMTCGMSNTLCGGAPRRTGTTVLTDRPARERQRYHSALDLDKSCSIEQTWELHRSSRILDTLDGVDISITPLSKSM